MILKLGYSFNIPTTPTVEKFISTLQMSAAVPTIVNQTRKEIEKKMIVK